MFNPSDADVTCLRVAKAEGRGIGGRNGGYFVQWTRSRQKTGRFPNLERAIAWFAHYGEEDTRLHCSAVKIIPAKPGKAKVKLT